MFRFALAASLLLPQLGFAQLFGGSFTAGSYVLEDSPTVRQSGQLKLQSGSLLVVKNAAGKNLKLKPAQVTSFRIGSQRYSIVSNFHVSGGLGGIDVDEAFVEQLDSGRVELLRYTYALQNVGAGGMGYGSGEDISAFLLRMQSDFEYKVAQSGAYSSGGKKFRETLRPYFAARPDLLKLLDEKRITATNLPAAIHALNTNLPFTTDAVPDAN